MSALYCSLRSARYAKNCLRWYCSSQSPGKWKQMELVISSLRLDAIAAKGLSMSRNDIWEISLDNRLYLNGVAVKKSKLVTTGDVVEVDDHRNDQIVRGRVEILEIGEKTNKVICLQDQMTTGRHYNVNCCCMSPAAGETQLLIGITVRSAHLSFCNGLIMMTY
ncbi:uncharacterized protein [Dysidea avara]|uniref:uncharacterized protein n=1 Tax=Dysidea avara TaxID=196820 RepID=UPI00331F6AF1